MRAPRAGQALLQPPRAAGSSSSALGTAIARSRGRVAEQRLGERLIGLRGVALSRSASRSRSGVQLRGDCAARRVLPMPGSPAITAMASAPRLTSAQAELSCPRAPARSTTTAATAPPQRCLQRSPRRGWSVARSWRLVCSSEAARRRVSGDGATASSRRGGSPTARRRSARRLGRRHDPAPRSDRGARSRRRVDLGAPGELGPAPASSPLPRAPRPAAARSRQLVAVAVALAERSVGSSSGSPRRRRAHRLGRACRLDQLVDSRRSTPWPVDRRARRSAGRRSVPFARGRRARRAPPTAPSAGWPARSHLAVGP